MTQENGDTAPDITLYDKVANMPVFIVYEYLEIRLIDADLRKKLDGK